MKSNIKNLYVQILTSVIRSIHLAQETRPPHCSLLKDVPRKKSAKRPNLAVQLTEVLVKR